MTTEQTERTWYENVEVVDFFEHTNDKLRGFLTLRFPDLGIEMKEFKVLEMEHGEWIAGPTKEYKKRDGSRAFQEIVNFINPKDKKGFQESVLRAWEIYKPRPPADREPSFS